jgi:hypothetical protein
MAEFSAALFATQERPDGPEHRLIAHALLFQGARPYWEVYIKEKLFRFIPHPEFQLEEGLWQLNSYCQIPENEYKFDVSNNAPLTLEEEFGEDTCKSSRDNIVADLLKSGIQIKLVKWPGNWMDSWNEKIKLMQDQNVPISMQ